MLNNSKLNKTKIFIVKVGRTTLDSREELVLEDFSHVEKMSFPAAGSTKPGSITPPHSLAHTFKFKSYSLQVFRRIRNFFGIDNAEYMMSVCGTYRYNFALFHAATSSSDLFFVLYPDSAHLTFSSVLLFQAITISWNSYRIQNRGNFFSIPMMVNT